MKGCIGERMGMGKPQHSLFHSHLSQCWKFLSLKGTSRPLSRMWVLLDQLYPRKLPYFKMFSREGSYIKVLVISSSGNLTESPIFAAHCSLKCAGNKNESIGARKLELPVSPSCTKKTHSACQISTSFTWGCQAGKVEN